MGWLNKKSDPVSARARALDSQITALEQQINQLNSQIGKSSTAPRLRSTALPHGATVNRSSVSSPPPSVPEPIFEDVNQDRLKAKAENVAPPEQFNELGVRKYDLAGLINRVKSQFRGPPTNNPRLVNYLAAGGVQGLRPLRYEKRVSRNRFIAFAVGLLLLLLGILSVYIKNH